MPDLIVHAAAGFLAAEGLGILAPACVIGSLIPDLLRSLGIVADGAWTFCGTLHEPLPVTVACLLLSRFFAPKWRTRARTGLLIGAGSHLLLDLMQDHMGRGYFPFFPFSRMNLEWPILPPEGHFWAGPLLLLLGMGLWMRRRARA